MLQITLSQILCTKFLPHNHNQELRYKLLFSNLLFLLKRYQKAVESQEVPDVFNVKWGLCLKTWPNTCNDIYILTLLPMCYDALRQIQIQHSHTHHITAFRLLLNRRLHFRMWFQLSTQLSPYRLYYNTIKTTQGNHAAIPLLRFRTRCGSSSTMPMPLSRSL